MPKVSIIILNWNGWEDTIECLESLYQIDYPKFDVIVLDNASSDGSIGKIRKYCEGKLKVKSVFFKYCINNKPIKIFELTNKSLTNKIIPIELLDLPSNKKLILIRNDSNYGFAKGNNIGIQYALNCLKSDYILLLNNDTVVNKDFLNNMINVGEQDKKIGIIGPIINYYENKDIIWFAGGKMNWFKYPFYHHIGINDKEKNFYSGLNYCDWITGAAILIKTNIKDIKLNNRFFFGCEDVDLSLRVKNNGYKIVCVLDSKIWHKIGSSRKKSSNKKIVWIFRNLKTNLELMRIYKKVYLMLLPIYIFQILLKPLENFCINIFRILFRSSL